MKKTQLLFLIAIGIFLSFSSCKKNKKGDNIGTNQSSNPAVLDLGSNINAKFFARIIDEDGNAIEDALVAIGNKTASTDENGIVIIENASVKEKIAYMTVVKSGYFLGSRSVIAQTTGTNEIRITLLTKNIIATINSGSASTVTTTSGLKIDFEGEYVNEDGTLYNGDVNVAIKHIDPTDDDFSNQMPGSLYAQNEENNEGVLESYGMAAIEISSPSGEELQIAKGSKATIHMPVSNAQIDNAPSTIPLWHFDEEAGYWIEEGEVTLINGEYVGEVQHFSFWNCDVFFDPAFLTGQIIDASGNNYSFANVEIITPNGSTVGIADINGNFDTYIPANVSVTFNIYDNCGNIMVAWTNTFVTSSINSHTFIVTNNINQIAGTLVDCNNIIVSNGYIALTFGNNTYFPTVTNGIFSVSINNCNFSPTSFIVQGYDQSTSQSTGILSFTTTSQVTNIGNIIACNNTSEFITFSYDGMPAITIYTNIECYETPDSLIIKGAYYIPGVFQSFHVNLVGHTLGVYNYNSGISSSNIYPIILKDDANGEYSFNWFYSINSNLTFNLNTYGPVGTYIDASFSGTFTHQLWGSTYPTHNITGNLHVLRDN